MKSRPQLTIIVAVTNDNAIGVKGDLAVRLKPDMRHFREITTGHPVIMGRKTWESLPGALKGRRNMVVTRNADYSAEGAEVFTSLEAALEALNPDDHAYIIGGAQIYQQSMPLADTIELTRVDTLIPDADTFFPAIDSEVWHEDESASSWNVDPDTSLRYRFSCLYRR